MNGKVLLVSPRAPRRDGRGDQRRAWEILEALSADWDVEVLSWLPELDLPRRTRWVEKPLGLIRGAALAAVRPVTVAYVQGHMPRSLRRRVASGGHDLTVFVTDRAVPRRVPDRALVDFVDDLGGATLVRGRSSPGLEGLFWRFEGRRIQRLDRRLAEAAALAVAHSPADAAGIAPQVASIALSAGTRPMPDDGTRIAFVGNLFYGPNHEAAMWICSDLVPALASLGIGPDSVVVAGRQPLPELCQAADVAGIDLRANVPDLNAVLAEAAVVLAPMKLGAGAQYKVIDAVGAHRACVLSSVANSGLGLVDGRSALIRDRQAAPFAEAVATLLADPALRRRLSDGAAAQLDECMPETVAASWRRAATVAEGRSPGTATHPTRAAGEDK